MNDLVVVLPGILGSTLRDENGPVWEVSGRAALRAVLSFGRSLRRMTLPEDIGDEHPGDGIEPVALMADLHVLPGIWTPLKGYDRLTKRLRSIGFTEEKGNLLLFPYDWRLSNRYNGARLGREVERALGKLRETQPDAKAVFVCHSMGGLVARWYIEKCGGHEVTRKLITIGTPYRGAAAAVEQLVNGLRKGLGPLAIDLTEFARSMPSLHQLMPEYACVESPHGLLKTTETTLPELRTKMVEDAMAFHVAINNAEEARPASATATHAIIGAKQPTATTIRIADGKATPVRTYDGRDLFGDSTVPSVGSTRPDVMLDSNVLRRVTEQHTSLQDNPAVLDEVESIITAVAVQVRNIEWTHPRVTVPDLLLTGEDLPVDVELDEENRRAVKIAVTDEAGRLVESRAPSVASGIVSARFPGLAPGAYSVQVSGLKPGAPVAAVTSAVLVMDCPEV
ncbi:hypothetical protein FKR81_34990 [Lentzea tibetensis]|uniref:Lecithin:cholesterol acyltransferase n=1 Tax=Lentzea tibetensis TaxID=2591470 RepID=A0A563EJG3_9PSEU|nr:hypothetical protein [Lentzea tibetensis]TWP46793.1 hypothetical protein FKR81_34990 [Lentzea tibetensis]